MLPDFPDAKSMLLRRFLSAYGQQVDRGVLPLPWFCQHEGDRNTLQREDGTIHESAPGTLSVDFEIPKDQLPNMSLADIERHYVSAGRNMAGQLMGSLFRAVDRATEQAGTAIDASGRPLTSDLFLDLLDRVELDFDSTGSMIPPSIVLHPHMWEAIKDDVAGWETDREFLRRYRPLIERKREDWRERESRRKLVD